MPNSPDRAPKFRSLVCMQEEPSIWCSAWITNARMWWMGRMAHLSLSHTDQQNNVMRGCVDIAPTFPDHIIPPYWNNLRWEVLETFHRKLLFMRVCINTCAAILPAACAYLRNKINLARRIRATFPPFQTYHLINLLRDCSYWISPLPNTWGESGKSPKRSVASGACKQECIQNLQW